RSLPPRFRERLETPRIGEDRIEGRLVGDRLVACAECGERTGVIFLSLLAVRFTIERQRELLLARGQRPRVGQRPGKEHHADLVPKQWKKRAAEGRPALELALVPRIEHATSPGEYARRAVENRGGGRIRRALVDLRVEPEV